MARAALNSMFQHIAIMEPVQDASSEWLEYVDTDAYIMPENNAGGASMKKQIVGTVVFAFFVAAAYMMSCLLCIANSDYVFQDDYARMSQEIVEQSIEMKANR